MGRFTKECGERHLVYVNMKAVPDMQQDKRGVCRKETKGRLKGDHWRVGQEDKVWRKGIYEVL